MAGGPRPRRWPPLVATGVAAVLVFLVLPNPLRIPQQNPTASAEYAPVPGRTQQSGQSNFAETNLATSSGIGASGEGIGALPGQLEDQLPPQFKPRQKQCVGNPPRQTEDPLSPPCVAFFEGDNGGATYPGVSKDEIKVVFYADGCCAEKDFTEPWKPSDEERCTYYWECKNLIRTIKGHLRYFQHRYQTYGRTVRVIGQKSSGDLGAPCASRQGDAQTTLANGKPFATVFLGEGGQCYMDEMAKRDVPNFGVNFHVQRQRYEDHPGLIWGFFPDQETEAAWSSSFICDKLVGHTAQYAGDPTLQDNERTFGFIRPEGDSRGPELRQQADLLEDQLRDRCNFEFDEIRKFDATSAAGAGANEAPQIMSDFKRLGITTIVCYCTPVPTEATAPTMQKQASSLNYRPEWFWDPASYMDRGIWQQQYGSADQPSMGVTYSWRNPAFKEQFHYQAYLAEEPGTQPNTFRSFEVYHLFLNLFQAVQAAGPNLTPETVERGMFTFNYLDRANPYIPVGGYGPYNADAVSPYTFVDTAMAFWWDPAGTPPGGQRGEGCMRVVRQGLRAYPTDWPGGDGDLFNDADPCSVDWRELDDPGGTTNF